MRNFIGRGNFTWFVGVVEDRDDPVQLGRVRVRCYGYHTEDKGQIPTEDLPWAIPINPIQSASVSGVGHSPTGLVEGSWVVGFFIDGDDAQEPMILGSIYGAPSSFADPSIGFNDPLGMYPRYTETSDVNFAARENYFALHQSRVDRENGRLNENNVINEYFTGGPPKVSSVAEDKDTAYYASVTWQEPPVGGVENNVPEYPYNHVRETEGGHLEEFDDTEGERRYHRYHPSGTFTEIVDDGQRTVKIVGKDYEIVLDDKNIYIDGNFNVTVNGTKRELIKGNYHLEVEGETSFNLKGSLQTKIGTNYEMEVGKAMSTNIGTNHNHAVMGDQSFNVVGNKNETIGGAYQATITGAYTNIAYGKGTVFFGGSALETVIGDFTSTVSGTHKLGQATYTVTTTGTKTETAATGNVTYTAGDVDVSGISLVSHTHSGVTTGASSTGAPE